MEMNSKGFRLKTWTTKKGNTRGGEKFQKTNVSRILNDPVYIGKVKYKGAIYDGQHSAIVSEDLFNAVQSILNANNVTKSGYRQADNTFLLKGLVRCGQCKTAMAPSYALSRGKKYFYYRCNTDNDKSKIKCRIGSVHGQKIEDLGVCRP
jgi:site-specific DNA recombinase